MGPRAEQARKGPSRFVIGLTVFTALAFGLYTALWMMGARTVKNAVLTFVDEQRAAGVSLTHGAIKSEGFPFLLRTRIIGIDWQAPQMGHWRADGLYIDALPYAFDRVIFSPQGKQVLRVAALPPPYRDWTGSGETIRASIGRDRQKGWAFILDVKTLLLAADAGPARLSLGDLIVNIHPDDLDGEDLLVSALAGSAQWADGEARAGLTALELVAVVSDYITLNPEAPQGWAGTGGTVRIERLLVADNPAQLTATGDLSLDPSGQPTGRIETLLQKPGNFIVSLGALGALDADARAAAMGGLAVASLAGGGNIKNIFTLENGEILVDGVPLTPQAPSR
ncbi:MAG: DUF2125 domain-containing protein [Pseudomonadota bacterium]